MKKHINKTVFIFLLVVLAGPFFSFSQDDWKNHPFINYSYNRFYFGKDSLAFMKLCGRLNTLSSSNPERINVVHFGGSHVQGGIWSNTFVTLLQKRFAPDGGGYFVFPYRMGKTNGQPYARSFTTGKWKLCRSLGVNPCYPLGPCALSLKTTEACTFGACLTTEAVCKKTNRVKVYHNFCPGYELKLVHPPGGAKQADWKEQGYSLFEWEQPVDSVVFELKKLDTLQNEFILFGLSLENTGPGGIYFAGLGANGASSATFLRCNDLEKQLRDISPDLVIMSLGVNDTQSKGFAKEDYIEHYDSLIAIIRKASPKAQILLTTTTDNYVKRKSSNKRTIPARDAMFELMEKHHVAVWDLFSLMGGYKSISRWYKAGLAVKDKVHFTARGYVLIGRLQYEAFMKAFDQQTKIQRQ